MAYVSNEASNDVSVVDLVRRAVVATIPVGNAPRKVAVQPGPIRQGGVPEPAPTAGRSVTIEGVTFADHGTLDVGDGGGGDPARGRLLLRPDLPARPAGQHVRLNVENLAGTLHNLSMPRSGSTAICRRSAMLPSR
jgi:YVTN family beta-propeller protein